MQRLYLKINTEWLSTQNRPIWRDIEEVLIIELPDSKIAYQVVDLLRRQSCLTDCVTRLSKDKTPYKTHIGVWFWEGKGPKMENSSYYFHLEPPNLMLGIGIHRFSKTLLKVYRDSVVDPEFGLDLEKAIEKTTQQGQYSIGGKHYKRVPRGYDPEDDRTGLLLFNGLYAGVETEIPTELYSNKILDYCLEKYRDMIPVHNWLYDMTGRAAII